MPLVVKKEELTIMRCEECAEWSYEPKYQEKNERLDFSELSFNPAIMNFFKQVAFDLVKLFKVRTEINNHPFSLKS